VPIASTPEQHALQGAIRDWAKRAGSIAAVRAMEEAPATDLGAFAIIDPQDAATVADLAAAAEQLAASLVPGPIMPTLLASALGVKARPAAVALTAGQLTALPGPDGAIRVSGETGPVLGASTQTMLLLEAGGSWFTIDPAQPGVTITPRTPLDFSREVADVHLDNVPASPVDGIGTQQVRDLAATLFAAEAAGVAAWCSGTATDYAKTRKQFGRLIGEFQAVKHLCATMHCRTERAAALAWDAARAADETPAEHGLAAAAAAAQALDDAVENAKDCIQVLGGIGFTWEHDAHLYLRRALALRLLLGPSAEWRELAAQLTRDGVRRRVYEEVPAGTPEERDIGIGTWAASAIQAHGSEQQKDRFIEPTLTAEITWCQLFSEPEAGSDLAGLKTKAVKADGGWRLTGQKVWTSLARQADYAICLARTDSEVPKHKGLGFFLVDMHSDGIDIRPLREMTGRSMFNEVFLDEVFVPDDGLVGAPGDGWRVAMTTLGTEREALGGADPVVALLELRGAHPAVRKLLGVEYRQAAAEAALTELGPAGAVASEEADEFLLTRCLSIAGGTTQILLNQVAERVLGLPREAAR
jgi:alkylation response protein AidB-like acyl-CoA dehydrogenase